MKAGMNVARLNFSHGRHDEYAGIISDIRASSQRLNLPIAILQDLQGPKLRLGSVAGDQTVLERDSIVRLAADDVDGDGQRIAFPHPQILAALSPGDQIFVSDGLIRLEVHSICGDEVQCKVADGGVLRSRAGVNLPGTFIGLPSLTDKDLADLEFGIEHAVDWVALSFVRTADDVSALRNILEAKKAGAGLVAKLEKPEALEALDEILLAADAVMVARGDLGVEISPERVPFVQKQILERAAELRVPAITATQMLESMVENPRPTRAEASDVANAIVDRTDAVMLSSETSIGKHSLEAVNIMDRIVRAAERNSVSEQQLTGQVRDGNPLSYPDAIAEAACNAAHQTDARAIVAFTESGSTAQLISKYRPSVPIYALTPSPTVFRRLCLFWGVQPQMLAYTRSTTEMIAQADRMLTDKGLIQRGDGLVVLAGLPSGRPGTTNLLKLHYAGDTVMEPSSDLDFLGANQ